MPQGDRAIWYAQGIDNSGLRRGQQEANTIWKNIGDTATKEGMRIDSTFKEIAKSLGLLLGAREIVQFGKEIVRIRGEFQKLEVAFEVLLDNKEQSNRLLSDMIKLASTTPFSLRDVTTGARQLLAYGFAADSIVEDLQRLGDVSSSLGLPLERLTYLYGTTMTQGQLYARDLLQFTTSGVPLLKALADEAGVTQQQMRKMIEEGKIGFPEVQKAIYAMTNEGGIFYNMMDEISKTIPGKIEKLRDAWELMLNDIGKNQQGLITGSIEVVAELIQNYEKVGRVLAALIATYGAYRAAMIATASVANGYTISQLAQYNALLAVEKAQKLLNKTMLANPYVLVTTLVVGAAAAMWAFSKNSKVAADELSGIGAAMQKAGDEFNSQQSKVQALSDIINDGNAAYEARKKAIEDLRAIIPNYNAYIDEEGKLIKQNTNAIKEYLTQLERQIKMKAAIEELEENYRNIRNQEKEILQLQEGIKASAPIVMQSSAGASSFDPRISMQRELDSTENALEQTRKNINELNSEITRLSNGVVSSIAQTADTTIGNSSDKAKKEAEKNANELLKMQKDLAENAAQARVDAMSDGLEKELAQNALNHQLQIEQIKQFGIDLLAAYQKVNKDITELPAADKILIQDMTISANAEYRTSDDGAREKEKDRLQKLLEDFRTYQERYTDIEKKYRKIREDIESAGGSYSNISEANRQEQEELKAIDAEFASREATFRTWMNQIAKMSLNELTATLQSARSALDEAERSGVNGNALAEARARVDKAQDEINKRAESADSEAPDKAYKEWQKLYGVLQKVEREFSEIGNAIGGAAGEAIKASGQISESALTIIGGIAEFSEMSSNGISATATAAEKAISAVEKASVILSIIGAALKVVQVITGIFDSNKQAAERASEANRQYNQSLREIEAERTLEGNANIFGINEVEKFISAVGLANKALLNTSNIISKLDISNLAEQLKVGEIGIKDFINRADGIEADFRSAWQKFWGSGNKNIIGFNLADFWDEETLDAEGLQKWLDANREGLDTYEQEVLEGLIAAGKEYAMAVESQTAYLEQLWGDLASSIADNMIEAFIETGDAASNLEDLVDDVSKNMAKSMIQNLLLENIFDKDLENQLLNFLKLGEQEKANNLIQEAIKSAGELAPIIEGIITSLGIMPQEIEAASRTSASQGFAQASQDSIDGITGIFTNIQNHTYGIYEIMKVGQQNTNAILGHISAIHSNTDRLSAIENYLRISNERLDDINDGINAFTRN